MLILKNKFAICALAGALLVQTGLAAFADESDMEPVAGFGTEPAVEPAPGGPLTRSGHPAWTVCSFPLRLATGVGGMMVGAVVRGSKNVAKTEQEFARESFGNAKESPVLYPIGVLGSVIAVPVGFVTGMSEGAEIGARSGFKLWDHL